MNTKRVVRTAVSGVVLLSLWLIQAGGLPPAQAQIAIGTQFRIDTDAAAHDRYGLFYPVTYIFEIPTGSSSLRAQYRYAAGDAWQALPERLASELFNGVAAARFDYTGNRALLSVGFDEVSDSIYVRVIDPNGTPVELGYEGIARHYDNRRAAVTITIDDWANYLIDSIEYASDVLADLGLYHTVAVVTGGLSYWSELQARVDTGYTEAAAHTRYHPCSAADYAAYGGYTAQIAGSRDDLLTHLNLDPPYVPAFIQPCGFEDSGVRQALVAANFLADRDYETTTELGDIDFAPWGGDGAYRQIRSTYLVYTYGTRWQNGGSPADLAEANAAFDTAYAAGGIYHLTDHPSFSLWYPGSYLYQHLQYIAGRPDVWYVSFGRLYMYHFVQERGLVSVSAINPTTPTPSPTLTVTPSPSATPTSTATPTVGPSPTPSDTPTPSPTPTASFTPSATYTPTPTATPTDTPMVVYASDPNLQGLWRFEEVSGDRFDTSSRGNTLTDYNTVGSGSTSPPQGTRYATFVRASSEYLRITDAAQSGLDVVSDYSLSVWLRPNTGGYTSFGLVEKWSSTSPSGYMIYFSSGTLRVEHRSNWSNDYDSSTVNLGDEIRDGNAAWTHLTITYDAETTTVTYYINGAVADSATDLSPASGDNIGPFVVGSHQPWTGYYTGYLDELAFFNRTLSPGDVLAIYTYDIQ